MAPPPLLGSTDLWRPVAAARGGGWATAAALLLLASHLAVLLVRRRFRLRGGGRIAQTETAVAPAPASTPLGSASGIEGLVTEGDLRQLVGSLGLGAREPEAQGWEHVISKSNDDVSYKAWCDKPTAGPPKYLSITTYERCSTEQLRDFYMDNEYRMEWDSTVTKHEQLQYDENSGVEVGRTIKKFPLLTPREYILAWRVWEANDKSFYCFIKVTPPAFFELYILCASEVSYLFTRKKYIYNYLPQMFGIFSYATSMAIASAVSNIVQVRKKQKKKTYDSHEVITVLELMQNEECEHPLAARQRKFVRVRLLISGWCIRKIPGRDACQITVLHHEDNGMNIEMAKLAFSKGIWSYICKMNNALRRYPQHRTPSLSILTMQKLMKKDKFPQDLEAADANLSAPQNTAASAVPSTPTARTSPCKLPGKKSSRQMIASGLLLVGSIVCLSRGRSNLGAQLAMAFFLKKAFKQERIRLIDIKGENRRA